MVTALKPTGAAAKKLYIYVATQKMVDSMLQHINVWPVGRRLNKLHLRVLNYLYRNFCSEHVSSLVGACHK